MEHCAVEVDLVPAQVADLGRPQPVPEGEQDHGRVTMAMPVALGGLDHCLDLARRQVLSSPEFGVRTPPRSNCSFYFGWRDQLERRFCHEKQPSPNCDCS